MGTFRSINLDLSWPLVSNKVKLPLLASPPNSIPAMSHAPVDTDTRAIQKLAGWC